jgi:hypothetical protein
MEKIYKKRWGYHGKICSAKNNLSVQLCAMLYFMALFAVMVTCSTQSYAQAPVRISGTVTDDQNAPLPGVVVKLKNSTAGTVTSEDGRFSITVPGGNGILVFSFIGYFPQEIPVTNNTPLTVRLMPEAKSLDDVVVVGYGTQKKSDLTGSISITAGKGCRCLCSHQFRSAGRRSCSTHQGFWYSQ